MVMVACRTKKQAVGRFGEDAAARHLAAKGMEVVARNWRKGSYELDLICVHKNMLVFVEVKTRSENSLETPAEALNFLKKRSLARAAREYLLETGVWDIACRFDLVSVILEGRGGSGCHVEHIENVLDFGSGSGEEHPSQGNALDSGYTPWQPW